MKLNKPKFWDTKFSLTAIFFIPMTLVTLLVNTVKIKFTKSMKFTIDQTNNIVKDFTFQISNTEKIYLARNDETDEFTQNILVTKLSKKVVYKENSITDLDGSLIDEKLAITDDAIIGISQARCIICNSFRRHCFWIFLCGSGRRL